MNCTCISINIRDATLGSGVKPFRFHGLRRFVASILPEHKISTPTIQSILGHSKLTTTEKYIQKISSDVHQAMEVLAGGKDFTEGTIRKAEYPKSTPLDLSVGVPNRI